MENEALLGLRDIQALLFPQGHRVRHAAGVPEALQQPQSDVKRQVRNERVNIDGDILSYCDNEEGRVGVYIGALPFTPENNYFEIEILDRGLFGTIAIGAVPALYPLDRQPGWNAESVAYHSDDGKLFKSSGIGRPFGPRCYTGDRIGCGIKFDQAFENDDGKKRTMIPVFFTKNGKELGTVLIPYPLKGLHPSVGMHSEGEEVQLFMDAKWHQQDIILMSIDSMEEDFARLHDIRVNGSLLEYTGRGKSIIDVGLAQARHPLDTRNHYFEIELVDPGENCYIAIGLACRDYPKHRHPGWNKGSIAYHADDGKIFIGSGIGDPFGPKCQKGDTMGCGILFPRDYNSEVDSGGSQENSPDEPDDPVDYLFELNEYESESEDEEWWQRPYAENGTKVQVFFTRNGQTVGHREIRIPKGGFYPTIGMLSSDEKVKVDLRPLTG